MVLKRDGDSSVSTTSAICNATSSSSSSSQQLHIFGASQLWERRTMLARITEVISTVATAPTKKGTEVLDNRMGSLESREFSGDAVELRAKDSRLVKLEVKAKQLGVQKWFSDIKFSDSTEEATEPKVHASVYVGRNLDPHQIGASLVASEGGGGASRELRMSKPKINKDDEEVEADEEQVVIRRRNDEALKSFICGGFAGIVSRSAVAPLDLIKTHLITSHGAHRRNSGFDIFMSIWKENGWRGLFRGNGVNCIRVAPCKAIELCVFETVKKILGEEGHPLQRFAAPLAGGAAGMAGTLVTYPLELIRTRISLQPKHYSGLRDSLFKICNEEGFFALYAGLTPSMLGVFPYAAANYFVYDGLRSSYVRASGTKHVPTGLTLLFGAVAAAASSAITYPLEVARRQMQLGSAAMVTKGSTIELVRHIYKEEGFVALYRGLGMSWLKLIPAAGISFVCYEAARSAWEREMEKESKRH